MKGRAAWTAVALACVAVWSCGGEDDGGSAPTPVVTQHVTRDFGRGLLGAQDEIPLERPRTALALLRRHYDVETSDGGATIEAVDGLRRHDSPPWPEDVERLWALYVNGIEADTVLPDYRLYDGDVLHWDRRDWAITLTVRATVGGYPETFSRGIFGKRFPVTVECSDPLSAACARVKHRLRAAGAVLDRELPRSELPERGLPQRARVLVGPWQEWRRREWPNRVDEGPRYGGIFARFSPSGDSLRLLDWDVRRAGELGAGTGLVGALRPTEETLLWLITGVDELGVDRASRALRRDALRDTYAVAVTADRIVKLPLPHR